MGWHWRGRSGRAAGRDLGSGQRVVGIQGMQTRSGRDARCGGSFDSHEESVAFAKGVEVVFPKPKSEG
jgi:hypothetical protein